MRDQTLPHEGAVEFFLARQAQLDRMARGLLRHHDGARLHRDARFAAKAAADVRRDDAQVALAHPQCLGNQVTLRERRLARCPERDLA
jgi:hypothetical protein